MEAFSETDRAFDDDYPTTGAVRADVGSYLEAEGIERERIDDALLVLSELYDNAVRYGEATRPVVAVGWGVDDDGVRTLRITVTNEGDVRRVPPRGEWVPADPLALSGRGLSIVDTIARSVEVEGDATHTSIRAELRVA